MIWFYYGRITAVTSLLLTDGGVDAAILVASAIQRRQSCDCLLGYLMLGIHRREKDEPKKGKPYGIQPAGESFPHATSKKDVKAR